MHKHSKQTFAQTEVKYKKNVFPDFTDGDFEKMNGVVFMDQQGLLYGSCWDDRELSEDLFEEKEEEIEVYKRV